MAPITPKQLSSAQALLGWWRGRLAAVAEIPVYYIQAAGVEFVGSNGVRLRHPSLSGVKRGCA